MTIGSLTLTGFRQADRQLERMQRELRAAEYADVISKLVVKKTKENIKRGVDSDGIKFVPLKEETIERRRREGIGTVTPMFRSGKLRQSMISTRDDRFFGTENITTVRVGPDNRKDAGKAAIHLKGTSRHPARAVLGIGKKMQDQIEDAVVSSIATILR